MRRTHAPSAGRAAFQPPRPVGGGGAGAEAGGGGGDAAVSCVSADAPVAPVAVGLLQPTSTTATTSAGPPLPAAAPAAKRAKFLAPPTSAPAPRPPLAALAANAGLGAPPSTISAPSTPALAYYAVLYCKRSNKKRINKSFADGALEVKGDAGLTLMDDEGKVVGRGKLKGCGAGLPPGATGEVGQWEFEVVESVAAERFASGELFIGRGGGGGGGGASTSAPSLALALARPAGPHAPVRLCRPAGGGGGGASTASTPTTPAPLFDPDAPDALVLHPGGAPASPVPVVADPFLARRMRPHQREGLAFLYAAVTGARTPGHTGCVLAHEMGLGKTLTSLALVWTLLRQGPSGRPLARRAVVACPSSLVDNWQAEARKWLGDERLKTVALRPGGDTASAIAGFLHGGVHPVLIASYEALRKVGPALGGGRVDLLIADEGHRLKAAGGNQTIAALKAVGCKRVVLLTGTPLQNNLSELYSVLEFVAPGFLGSLSAFTRVFADPIARSRDPGAKPAERELGARRAEELASRVEAIVLKGPPAAEVNAATLPPCAVYDIFVRLQPPAVAAYKAVLASAVVTSLTRAGTVSCAAQASVLPAIGLLRALCIAPGLALGKGGGGAGDGGDADPHVGAAAREAGLPALLRRLGAADAADPAASAKLAAAGAITAAAVARGDKVVLVSTSTAALDAAEAHLRSLNLITVRIDGSVDAGRRQAVVDAFNNRRAAPSVSGQALLLSMRAGGAGLNLVGAAVMVMLDLDWNPAVVAQAAARCWRPGQTRPCAVLRLHAAGTIDERLLLRLHHKAGLAVALEAGGGGGAAGAGPSSRRSTAPAFTPAELRALFSLDAGVAGCGVKGLMVRGDGGGGGGGGFGGGGGGRGAEATTAAAASWATDAREAEAGLTEAEDGAAVAAAPLLAAAAAAAEVTWVHREPGGGSGVPVAAAAAPIEEEEEEEAAPDDGTPAAAAEEQAAPASDGAEELELEENE